MPIKENIRNTWYTGLIYITTRQLGRLHIARFWRCVPLKRVKWGLFPLSQKFGYRGYNIFWLYVKNLPLQIFLVILGAGGKTRQVIFQAYLHAISRKVWRIITQIGEGLLCAEI